MPGGTGAVDVAAMARHLPGLVEHLTPGGQLPDSSALPPEGASLLEMFFRA